MAQHDFVPAWLNFSTPQPTKSPAASLQRHGGHLSCGDARLGCSRRRHNSSDGFFNHDPLRAPAAGDGWWQQPSLLRHVSVDSGVAKGSQGGQGGLGSSTGGPGWKEMPSWNSGPWEQDGLHHGGRHLKRNGGDRGRERRGPHRQRKRTAPPRKEGPFPDGVCDDERHEDKLKFVEEDFPSLNPELSRTTVAQTHAVGTPAGVWENPLSAKQTVSKMLVIRKVSKEDPSTAFTAGFANMGPHPINGTKAPVSGASVYKNLVTKAATTPTKLSSSITPPIDITPSRLKLMRRSADRKSEFLRGLKTERNGEVSTSTSPTSPTSPGEVFTSTSLTSPGDVFTSTSPTSPGESEGSTPEPKENGVGHVNGISYSFSDSDTEHLSSSLEAEHRLLKAMGWQEPPENDENFQPLTEDELQEFQAKTLQLKRNGSGQNCALLKPRGIPLQLSWRNPVDPAQEEGSGSETSSTSSSQTSDDEANT